MAIALKRGSDGHLQQFQVGDTLSVDQIERLNSSGNLVIGSNLGATTELQLGSATALISSEGDTEVNGYLKVVDDYIELDDIAEPANAGAGIGRLFKKTGDDGIWWKPDGAGAAVDLTASGGASDHGALTGLGDDDHTQYALLAGRAGGQTLIGGTAASEDLTLESTANATKGNIIAIDEVIIQPGTASGATAQATADDLVIDSDGDAGISILTGNSSTGTLYFGDTASSAQAKIDYSHSNNRLRFYPAPGNPALTIISGPHFGFNVTSPNSTLLIDAVGDGTFDEFIGFANARAGSSLIAVSNYNTTSTSIRSGVILKTQTTTNTRECLSILAGWNDTTDATRTSDIDFYTIDSGTKAQAIRIVGQDVCIGTTVPAERLTVDSATTGVTALVKCTATDGVAQFRIQNDAQIWGYRLQSNDHLALAHDVTGSNVVALVQKGAPANSFVIESTGDIGFGLGNPTERLTVTTSVADTVAVSSIEATGTNGAKVASFVGTRDPQGNVTGSAGDIYYRDNSLSSGPHVSLGSTNWLSLVPPTFIPVNQTTHGFAVRDVLYMNTSGTFVKAQANGANTLGLFVVTSVLDTNNFMASISGKFTNTSHGLTVGNYYYLSDSTAGALTATAPTASTSYANPLVFVLDANTLLVLPFRPDSLSGGAGDANGLSLTAIKTAAYTTSVGERVPYNASGGTFTLKAPGSPSTGDHFGFVEAVSDATAITWDGNGSNIEHPVTGSFAATQSVGVSGIAQEYIYVNSRWKAI